MLRYRESNPRPYSCTGRGLKLGAGPERGNSGCVQGSSVYGLWNEDGFADAGGNMCPPERLSHDRSIASRQLNARHLGRKLKIMTHSRPWRINRVLPTSTHFLCSPWQGPFSTLSLQLFISSKCAHLGFLRSHWRTSP